MIPLNTQPPEHSVSHKDGAIEVVSAFDTIQGEGPFAGVPARFLRLAGCNLQCPACDTDYSTGRKVLSVDAALEFAHSPLITRPGGLLVITGGEPFRQTLGPFVREFMNRYPETKVQIESNGTIYQEDFPWYNPNFYLIVSPKTPKVKEGVMQFAHAVKYVVTAGQVNPNTGLPMTTLGNACGVADFRDYWMFKGDVYVQPADDKDPVQNKANQEMAVEVCMKWGYTLSLQLHKVLGLD